MNYEELYARLGDLYYAVAAVDREVQKKEADKLKEEIGKIWVPAENSTDEYGTDAAYYIWMSFETNDERVEEASAAWERFKAFYHDHRDSWDKDLKHKVEHTAAAIAHAFGAYNKSELSVLSDLHLLLQASKSK